MSDTKVGELLYGTQYRDAIHISVAPVVAAHKMRPGEHIGLVEGEPTKATAETKKYIGIVDPFLTERVEQGEQFWMFLYQRKVTGLRHVWSHPAFPDEVGGMRLPSDEQKSESIKWIEDYANEFGFDSQEMMDGAARWLSDGNYLTGGAEMEGITTTAEFWKHYQIAIGEIIPADKQGSFFRCAC